MGAGVAAQVALVLALVAGINALASRHPVPGLRGDWTADSRHTLQPRTEARLRAVQDPVDLVLLYTPISGRSAAQQAYLREIYQKTDLLIRQAAYVSPSITAESINVATQPDRAQAVLDRTGLKDQVVSGSLLLVHARGRNIQLPFPQLAQVDRASGQLRFQGEDALYKSVAEVTRREERMVTFVQGHGELDPVRQEEALALAVELNREAYRVGRVDLMRGEPIHPATSVLVVARPQKDLDREEIAAINEFHRRGGNLLLLIGARTPATRLAHYLRTQFKLELGAENEVLFDPRAAVRRFPDWMLLDRNFNPDHPVTRPLARAEQKMSVVFPRVRPIKLAAPRVCDYLVSSNPGAWPDKYKPGNYVQTLDDDEKVPGFEKQPFPVVVAVDPKRSGQDTSGEASGRMVLFGSGECASSQFLTSFPANAALLLNAIHWLSGKELGETIAPVATRDPRLAMTSRADRWLFWTVVILPSAIMVILGLLVFWLRRG